MGYIRDGFNPRGAEYAATARGADAAERTRRDMDDMLTLAMAPNERARMARAYLIEQRRRDDAARDAAKANWQIVGIVAFLAFVAGIFYLGSLSDADTPAIFRAPQAAVSAVDTSSDQSGALDAPAPVRHVAAPKG